MLPPGAVPPGAVPPGAVPPGQPLPPGAVPPGGAPPPGMARGPPPPGHAHSHGPPPGHPAAQQAQQAPKSRMPLLIQGAVLAGLAAVVVWYLFQYTDADQEVEEEKIVRVDL